MNTYTLNNFELDDKTMEMVSGGGFFTPDFVGPSVFDNRYNIPALTEYWAALDNGERTYFDKVLLLKVYEKDTGNFLFWPTSKTLAVVMDSYGNERTIPAADLYYVK